MQQITFDSVNKWFVFLKINVGNVIWRKKGKSKCKNWGHENAQLHTGKSVMDLVPIYHAILMHICTQAFFLEIKDTGQGVDPALYRLQKTSLGGHVLLGCHGNAVGKEKNRRVGFIGTGPSQLICNESGQKVLRSVRQGRSSCQDCRHRRKSFKDGKHLFH